MQARIADVLGLHDTNSRVSLNSITSLPGSINTKKGYKEFCKSLYQIGVTPDMISQKKQEILNIFESRETATGSQIGNSTVENQSQLPTLSNFSGVGILIILIDRNILT